MVHFNESEIEDTRQIPGEGIRRWFRDEELDLIIWYDDNRIMEGFQLCYDKSNHERALTWRRPNSYQHHAIDTGGPATGGPKMSPVLVADGVVDAARIEREYYAVPWDPGGWLRRNKIFKRIV